MKQWYATLGLFMMSVTSTAVEAQQINVTDFSQRSLDDWQERSFIGHTQYQITQDSDRAVLQAVSQASASVISRKHKVDLLQTPYINWSWFSNDRLNGVNEQSKDGDDYVARIYLVIDGGWPPWKSKALNYVWSSQQSSGAEWSNAFVPDNAKMVAVRGLESASGYWYQEKRNVYQDLIRAFGDKGSVEKNQKAYRYIDAIAIMTDTDNSGQQASALYGDIIFSSQ